MATHATDFVLQESRHMLRAGTLTLNETEIKSKIYSKKIKPRVLCKKLTQLIFNTRKYLL